MKNNQTRSASLDGTWSDAKESELESCLSKLQECEEAWIERPGRSSPEARRLIARLASACARLQDERDYAEHVAIQEYLEPLLEAYISEKLSESALTWRDFNRFSMILRGIKKQKLLRLQWSCAAT